MRKGVGTQAVVMSPTKRNSYWIDCKIATINKVKVNKEVIEDDANLKQLLILEKFLHFLFYSMQLFWRVSTMNGKILKRSDKWFYFTIHLQA